MNEKKLARINELAKKQRTVGLNEEEKKEQQELRQKYIQAFRASMRQNLESIKVIDEEGNDVTPKKKKEYS